MKIETLGTFLWVCILSCVCTCMYVCLQATVSTALANITYNIGDDPFISSAFLSTDRLGSSYLSYHLRVVREFHETTPLCYYTRRDSMSPPNVAPLLGEDTLGGHNK